MDSDAFAVWDDPKPAAAASSSAVASTSSPPRAADEARISLEYEDEDPGWGIASASTSRATSPEKSRKQPAPSRSRSQARLSPSVPAEPAVASDVASPVAVEETAQQDGLVSKTTDFADQVTVSTEEKEAEVAAGDTAEENGSEEDVFENTHEQLDTARETPAKPAQTHSEEESAALPSTEQEAKTKPEAGGDEEDGFDDFGEPSGSGAAGGGADADDFGDFDDFETGDAEHDDGFGDDFNDGGFTDGAEAGEAVASTSAPQAVPAAAASAAPTRAWTPLEVTTGSKRHDVASAVSGLLPLSVGAEAELSSAALRQVEGPGQVLVSAGSRALWTELSSLPSVKPIDWVRSRTRRDHLISMGVPVNLDEIHSSSYDSHARRSVLPPLRLEYDPNAKRSNSGGGAEVGVGLQRSSSLKLTGTGVGGVVMGNRSVSTSNSPRDGRSSPALGSSRERMAERRREELGLGRAPTVDLRRAEEMVGKSEEDLTLLSLPALRAMVRELNALTTATSGLLTHHLTLRESYQADSEMYNSMIKELVTGAASRFSGGAASSSSASGGRGDMRRSTTMGVSTSNPGKARVNSLPPASIASNARAMSPSLRGGVGSSPRR